MNKEKKKGGLALADFVLYFIVILLVFGVLQTGEAGQRFQATVVKVVDGDSIQVRNKQGTSIRVRLWGIDTPEWKQPFSKVAKKYTEKLVKNTVVELEGKDWDDYGRLVAIITTEKKQCLNEQLVKAGLAWVHIYYCKEAICDSWYEFERQARINKSGLWHDKSPIPPWVWKRKKNGR